MSELLLLPTLDRLAPYDGDGMAFGLTLQAALGTDVAIKPERHATFVQPWEWKKPLSEARLILVDDQNQPIEGPSEPIALKGFDAARELIVRQNHQGNHEAWRQRLRASFDSSVSNGKTRWNWLQGEVELEEGSTYWPAFLGEISLLPWPLPQSLGLSFFLKTPKLDAGRLVVAPVLPAGLLGDGWPRLWPVPRQQAVAQKTILIDYFIAPEVAAEPDAADGDPENDEDPPPSIPSDPPIVAVAMPITLEKAQGCFFDLGNLWVKKPGKKEHVFRDDWRSSLEDRLAEGLHLLPLFVHSLSSHQPETVIGRQIQDSLPRIARQGLAMLADVYGPGVRSEAPGDSILAHAAQELREKRAISEEDVNTLANEMAAAFYSSGKLDFGSEAAAEQDAHLLKWAQRVDSVLGDHGRAKALLERPHTFTREELFSSLLSLEGDLAAGERTAALYLQHWRQFNPSSLSPGARALLGVLQETEAPALGGLRRKLLWDQLGLIWKKLRSSFNAQLSAQDDLAKLRGALKSDLLDFIVRPGRLGIPLGGASFLKDEAARHVDRLLERVFPDSPSHEEPRRTRGLTVQVDTIACDPGDNSDFLERIQGVGLLMRRSQPAPTPWLPLNVGKACLSGGRRETPAVLSDRVLVPSRLTYRNGLRDVMLTYDNEPLGIEGSLAATLAAGLAPGRVEGEPTMKEPDVRFFESDTEIPALAYGATYEILPFLVTNNGAVPEALAVESSDLPWGGTEKVKDSTLSSVKNEVRTVQYKRLTPVGPLRVENVQITPGRRRPFELPTVPAGVALRARELPLMSWLPGEPRLNQKDSLAEDSLSHQLPCLFLAPQDMAEIAPVKVATSFSFGVRPPAVDLQTWDRFLALDFLRSAQDPQRQDPRRRQRVWESVHGLNLQNLERSLDNAVDASLDDPAVTGLEAELWEMVPGNPIQLIASQPVPWPAVPDREGDPAESESLPREQRDPAPIEIVVAPQAGLVPLPSGLRVDVREGGLYRLTLRARLDPQKKERFEKGVEDAAATSPWHLAIEVAEPFFLDQSSRDAMARWLWEHLTPDRQAAASGRLRATLGGWKYASGQPVEARLARHALRAELRHQMWGWRGRPPSPHPDLQPGASKSLAAQEEQNRYLAWELANLGDRREFECRRAAMLRRTENNQAGIPPYFDFDELLEAGGSLDRRAGHHRFGVHLASRYEPILPAGKGSVEARDIGASESPWRSLFVPCRFRGQVPAPKVRLILPLTDHQRLQEDDVERDAPGWLVVLDEEWFAVGGLAESLVVEVLGALNPSVAWTDGKPPEPQSCPTDEADYCYHQMGPDPIVTGMDVLDLIEPAAAGKPEYRALDASLYEVRFDAIHGPAGHHRDITETTPHILASSFVVRPPRIFDRKTRQPLATKDVAHWLYQIRLRRSLRIAGRDEPLLSEPSPPFWVQLLPAISRIEEEWIGTGPLQASLDARGGLEIRASGAPAVTHREGFELYAVLTRQIFDVAGSRDQEAYVTAVGPFEKGGRLIVRREDASLAAGSGRLKARLLEVQRRPGARPPSDAAELWKILFRADVPDRERGRIVRISRPFEVEVKRP